MNKQYTRKQIMLKLPGHGSREQTEVSLSDPVQFRPPCAGEGFVQLRMRTCVPFAQVTSHVPHCVHGLQWPSTR